MSNAPNLVHLHVWGDFACFTRPEMKVERVSYPLPTPSAARGILEAVFWEPQMYYLIDSIRVLKRGNWVSIRRNEVMKVISLDSAKTWMREPDKVRTILAGPGKDRDGTQRNMLALQDVAYVISAEIHTTPLADRPDDKQFKYTTEFRRRASTGKCFHRPGLGMREFAADFKLAETPSTIPACDWNEELGLMLYDVFDYRQRNKGFRWLRPDEITETATPEKTGKKRNSKPATQDWKGTKITPAAAFFDARVTNGVMDCHPDRVKIRFPEKGGE